MKTVLSTTLLSGTLAAALLVPFSAQAQNEAATAGGFAAGAATGAAGGALIGGPVGAAIGGVGGAVVGSGFGAAAAPPYRERVVVRDRVPSYTYEDTRVRAVPTYDYDYDDEVTYYRTSPRYYRTSTRYRAEPAYRYRAEPRGYRTTVINDRTVITDPRTRRVVRYVD